MSMWKEVEKRVIFSKTLSSTNLSIFTLGRRCSPPYLAVADAVSLCVREKERGRERGREKLPDSNLGVIIVVVEELIRGLCCWEERFPRRH